MPNTPNTKTVAIVQARMGSSRLPGKTLADIHGKPLLQHVIQRVGAATMIQEVVVATTMEAEDEAIVQLAQQLQTPVVRGSALDVLDRYYQAARVHGAGTVVRITADDPLKDPDVIDKVVVELLAESAVDYASNTLRPTYPEGLDVEAFTFHALEKAWREAALPSEREHVTPYIWKHPWRFRIKEVCHTEDLSHLRWTVDYDDDLRLVREVYARLDGCRVFGMHDILRLLQEHPELAALNRGIVRNEGYNESLKKDRCQR
jgi:spore coat polysaccharide biosynthesis protein SpsF